MWSHKARAQNFPDVTKFARCGVSSLLRRKSKSAEMTINTVCGQILSNLIFLLYVCPRPGTGTIPLKVETNIFLFCTNFSPGSILGDFLMKGHCILSMSNSNHRNVILVLAFLASSFYLRLLSYYPIVILTSQPKEL